MALVVKKVDVWSARVKDRPGALDKKLEALAAAGANLEFVLARRTLESRGNGIIFISPLRGARQTRAAAKAGFSKDRKVQCVRAAGPDRRGLGHNMAKAITGAGVDLRGFSASAVAKSCLVYIALDRSVDAAKTVKALKALK